MPETDDSETPTETLVQIPGFVWATYRNGVAERVHFTPLAGGAGYFGGSAFIWSGDPDLDVEDTEGPFWRAMQAYLAQFDDDEPSLPWQE